MGRLRVACWWKEFGGECQRGEEYSESGTRMTKKREISKKKVWGKKDSTLKRNASKRSAKKKVEREPRVQKLCGHGSRETMN